MKEFVEKLIERLEDAFEECIGWNHHKVNAYGHAIRIVKRLAEEYEREHIIDICNQICNKADGILREPTEESEKAEQIADDLIAVLKEAKSMGCKEVKCFHHVPLENVEITINALKTYNQDLIKKNQGWILCSERLPENYETVNITWINKKPAPYYEHIKDKPFMGTAIFHHGKWYWYSCVCEDYLRECGDSTCDRMDKDIEVIAWQPLPDPYKPEEKPKFSNEELDAIMDKILDTTQEEPQPNFYTERFNRVI